MKQIGILAYGSLINNPGKEIEAIIIKRIKDIKTPFKVEFARSSRNRDNAPTLVPVEKGGSNVKAQIFVVKEGVSKEEVMNILWRRETHQVDRKRTYKRPVQPNRNTVLIEQLTNFENIDTVLYTKIGSNIDPLTPKHLARLAIDSALSKAGKNGLDGIRYLFNAKQNGTATPLMPKYEQAILKELGENRLEDAFYVLHIKRLKNEGKIPKETEILTRPPKTEDDGKEVVFRVTIGKTYVKLSPPIALFSEYEGEKYPGSFTTIFLDHEVIIDNSYLYVSFGKNTKQEDVLDYFNNLMALLNIVYIPLDFITPSDILVRAKGLESNIELISSSKAHSRGYGIQPVEISLIDFGEIVVSLIYLWEKIKKSKYFKNDNFYILLGYANYYLFHQNYFLSFLHAWIFLESSINILWRELILNSFNIKGSSKKGTPLEDERNWTAQIKIDELFLNKIISKNLRDDLQSLRKKRNYVFHRDKKVEKRNVTKKDSLKATTTGLKLFYLLLDAQEKEDIIAFLNIRTKMWNTINRGPLLRTKIKRKKD